jgi:hypothetical protein
MVYEAQGATVPTTISENFDPLIFVTIYADKAALLGGGLGRLGGGPGRLGGGQVTQHSLPPPDVIDVDMEDEGSEWQADEGDASDEGSISDAGAVADEGDGVAEEEL